MRPVGIIIFEILSIPGLAGLQFWIRYKSGLVLHTNNTLRIPLYFTVVKGPHPNRYFHRRHSIFYLSITHCSKWFYSFFLSVAIIQYCLLCFFFMCILLINSAISYRALFQFFFGSTLTSMP